MAIDVSFVELLELSPSAKEQRFYLHARAVSGHASVTISPVGGFPFINMHKGRVHDVTLY